MRTTTTQALAASLVALIAGGEACAQAPAAPPPGSQPIELTSFGVASNQDARNFSTSASTANQFINFTGGAVTAWIYVGDNRNSSIGDMSSTAVNSETVGFYISGALPAADMAEYHDQQCSSRLRLDRSDRSGAEP